MTTGLQEDSKFDRVMRILREGPSTTGEVGAELEVPTNQASALLRDLAARGYAHSTEYGRGRFGNRLKLWHEGRAPDNESGKQRA